MSGSLRQAQATTGSTSRNQVNQPYVTQEEAALAREKKMQEAMIKIKNKYGKNAILKGMNLEEGATTASRNQQIGGHKA